MVKIYGKSAFTVHTMTKVLVSCVCFSSNTKSNTMKCTATRKLTDDESHCAGGIV